jgi:predicted phage baseplate assembly protein
MVPPFGRDNLKATYQAGGGAKGNVAAAQITTLRTTIPFVERVSNPEPAGGGSDTETLERALERGPQMLKHRGRAITAEDFEWIAREASRAVARVKCLPTFDDQGLFATDWVTLIIVPESQAERPLPSPQLRRSVATYVRERAANVVVFPEHVQVVGPTYVEVSVTATLFPMSIDLAPQIETQTLDRLTAFLHPLTGGYDGRGWEFGRLPCLSDFYTVLEAIAGVDHVGPLTMTLRAITPTGATLAQQVVRADLPVAVSAPAYTLVFSGTHQITVQPLR